MACGLCDETEEENTIETSEAFGQASSGPKRTTRAAAKMPGLRNTDHTPTSNRFQVFVQDEDETEEEMTIETGT
eukprot:3564445-Heterocapsa_arctica.AAC.1